MQQGVERLNADRSFQRFSSQALGSRTLMAELGGYPKQFLANSQILPGGVTSALWASQTGARLSTLLGGAEEI